VIASQAAAGSEQALVRGKTDNSLPLTRHQIVGVVMVVAAIAYANALANGFVLDDRGVVLSNPLVTTPVASWHAFAAPYWPAAIGGGQYRPLAILSFAIDWAISGGSAVWFHMVNVVWHALAAGLITVLALELLQPLGALSAGFLFAVHPVHVEAVANVVGRAEPIAAAGVLAALLLHRRRSWLAVPAFAIAVLVKEHALIFPVLAVVHDWLVPDRSRTRRPLPLYAGYAVVIAAWAGIVTTIFHDRPFNVPAKTFAGITTADRLTTILTVVPEYARLLVAPWQLSADYEPQVIPLAHGLNVAGVAGLLVLGAPIVAIAAAWRRAPVAAFALVWIAIALAPVSNVFIVTGVTLAERTLYLASIGICLLAGSAFDGVWSRRPPVAIVVTLIVAAGFAFRTWTRTPAWHDDRTYVLTLLGTHPESYRAHFVAGRVLAGAGRLDDASGELAAARALFARDPALVQQSAELELRRGHLLQARALADSAQLLAPGDSVIINLAARLRGAVP
jgi:protein O-mannosyl-transferase